MPPLLFRFNASRRALAAIGLIAAGLMTGCATTSFGTSEPMTAEVTLPPAPEPISVVRYSRYTLVELVPETAQQDLLQQVIDIAIPNTTNATVGDALRHVLLRSGYRLCEATSDAAAFHALPLPAAHMHLGPVTLHDALLTLAGPAWNLSIDDAAREVCFARHAIADAPVDPFIPSGTPRAAPIDSEDQP